MARRSSPPSASVERLTARVCSLLPSATEIVAALGLTRLLVARSADCDFPDEVHGLPVVTASRVDTGALPSRAVDAAVRDAVLSGRSLYAVDEELIRELAPDVVITQDLCHVCAVSGDELGCMRSLDVEVISLDPRTIGEVEETVRRLGGRFGAAEAANRVVDGMRATVGASVDAVTGRQPVPVFVTEWLDPPFAAGHWVPEMVALAGGREVLGRAGGPSYPTTWEEVAAAAPEVVVVAPCGFGAERAAAESAGVPFPCRAVAVEADAHYSRPAPRIAGGVAQLAHLLHPDAAPDPGLPAIELAAVMLAAAEAAGADLGGDVIVAAVCDEEHASIGAEAVVETVWAHAAIVTEPTGLDVCIAHKGFVWLEVEAEGVAAHGSRPDLGVDAIAAMGPVLVGLDGLATELAARPPHPVLGTGSVHASLIEGGQELSSYPERCLLRLERRTVPGETLTAVEAEVRALAGGAEVRSTFERPPFEVEVDAAVVEAGL